MSEQASQPLEATGLGEWKCPACGGRLVWWDDVVIQGRSVLIPVKCVACGKVGDVEFPQGAGVLLWADENESDEPVEKGNQRA